MATVLADYASAATQNHDRVLSITAGDYVVVYAGATGTSAQTGAATASVIAGSGLALTKIKEHAPAVNTSCQAAAWGGFATATGSVTVRVAFSGAPGDAFTYVEAEAGIDTASPFYGAQSGSGVDGTHPAITLTSTPDAAHRVRGLFVMRNKTAAATAGTGSALKAGFHAAPCAGLLLEGGTGITDPVVSATAMGSVYNAGIAFVLRTAAVVDPGVADLYVYDGLAIATSTPADLYVWDGSALIPADVFST